MARSLNKVMLLGNLTRDPELRYTPQGTAVCTFGMATNRQWKTESGDTRDEAEFHRIVAWTKLAEICAQLLKKGRRVYVEGRLRTRSWQGTDGVTRYTTEIVITDMMLLDPKGTEVPEAASLEDIPEDLVPPEGVSESKKEDKESDKKSTASKKAKAPNGEDDIPF